MLNQQRILVPTSMPAEGLAVLAARPELQITPYDPALAAAEFHALLADATAVALSFTRFGAAELAAAPLLRVAGRLGVGFDAVDVPALTARGVPLLTAGTANARSVAEHAMHLIFALAKKSAEMHRRMRTGEGHDRRSGLPGEVAGKTVLVVGFGRIGSRIAPRCKAMEMEVLVHDPYVAAEAIRAAGFEPAPDLDAALGRADYITLHCPKTPDTVGPARRRTAGPRQARRLRDQHRPRRHRGRGGAAPLRCAPATSPAPGSTCSTRSRPTPRIRCCTWRPCSRRRTWPASRPSPGRRSAW